MPTWSRRRLLSTVGAATATALAGCSGLRDGTLLESTSLEVRLNADHRSVADLTSPWDPSGPREAQLREAIAAAVDGERYVTYGYRPLLPDRYVEHEGAYYRTDSVAVGRTSIDRYVLRLDWVADVDDADAPAATPIDDLPGPDRSAARRAYFAARARHSNGGAPWTMIERGGAVYRFTDPAESELIPTPEHEHVRTHNAVLEVQVDRETIVEPAYLAVATRVAGTEAAYREAVLANALETTFFPDQVGAGAREVLTTLGDLGRYAETAPVTDGYATVLHRLGMHDAATLDARGHEDLSVFGRAQFGYGDEYYTCSLDVSEQG